MAMQTATESRTHNEYTVGWVCALPKEQTAATAMLDQRHTDLPKPPNDQNTYTLGSIGKHNIVIACLPKGRVGTNPAATVVAWMVSTFPSIKIGLMVGIGGGIPPKVRLGDVVVSTPVGQFPGVVQWDFGKAKDGGNFERTGSLNNPPTSLLTALTKLETEHELTGSKIPEYLEELRQKWPKLAQRYLRSDSLKDVLFKADYSHASEKLTDSEVVSEVDDDEEEEESCRSCDRTQVVTRRPRDMRVCYGIIASGNQVIKDAKFRDTLNKDLGGHVLCIEMEAAGLMNFPCIVIRGICDYADTHKNKDWQEHAAAVAAAFAKELLEYVQPSDVQGERPVKEILDEINNNLSRTEAHVKTIKDGLDNDKEMKILDWLTLIDYGPQQTDYIRRRQPGTGQWFLDSPEFQTWLNATKETLFCPGIPGAGKTILTAVVVDELTTSFRNDKSVGIAYLYCNFKRQHEQKAEDLLLSLLKQLTQSQSSLPESVKYIYDCHEKRRTRPSLDEISRALQSVASLYTRVFIIIDALDECRDSSQIQLLPIVFELQSKYGANIFATSRINDEIAKQFITAVTLKIRADNEDVKKYLNTRVELLKSDIIDNTIQHIIVSTMAGVVDGMFLLAELHMNTLSRLPTKGDIKSALQNLSKGLQGLDRIYKEAIERIDDYGKQILAWIVHARRPISTMELQHALAVRRNMTEMDEEFLPSIQVLRSRCAGLVTVDEESNIIRLVHYTTQEYFERTQKQWFPDAETKITETCVTYLSFDAFKGGYCQTVKEFKERLRIYQLYDYAANNWGHHARSASTSCQANMEFLQKQGQVRASSQGLMVAQSSRGYSQNIPKQMTALHLIAYFGVYDAVRLLIGSVSLDLKDSYGRTPLSWAAANGHEVVVKLLLETSKVDVNAKDNDGTTALLWATTNGHEGVVKLLLETSKVDVNAKDNDGTTALLWATTNGQEGVVKLLLETGQVDVDAKDNRNRTPLFLAAENKHKAVIKLLLETGQVDADVKDNNGRTLLFMAAEYGHEAIVKLLLETGLVDTNSKDDNGWTPLSQAAYNGHEAIVKLLLETGQADADLRNRYGQTPLLLAATYGFEAIVKLLLETNQVDANAKDNNSWTPLLRAADDGHEAIVKLLLETDQIDINLKNKYGQTPLLLAATYGFEAIVQLLLEIGQADANAKDNNGQTPLLSAADNGHEAIVKLLLETGQIDVDSDNVNSQAPL